MTGEGLGEKEKHGVWAVEKWKDHSAELIITYWYNYVTNIPLNICSEPFTTRGPLTRQFVECLGQAHSLDGLSSWTGQASIV